MPRVGFDPTIPVFELEKTVPASERAATVIGFHCTCNLTAFGSKNVAKPVTVPQRYNARQVLNIQNSLHALLISDLVGGVCLYILL
jgi:hypothetical protein